MIRTTEKQLDVCGLGGLSSIGGGPEAADWQRDDGWIRI